jgi:hypothetical protein
MSLRSLHTYGHQNAASSSVLNVSLRKPVHPFVVGAYAASSAVVGQRTLLAGPTSGAMVSLAVRKTPEQVLLGVAVLLEAAHDGDAWYSLFNASAVARHVASPSAETRLDPPS